MGEQQVAWEWWVSWCGTLPTQRSLRWSSPRPPTTTRLPGRDAARSSSASAGLPCGVAVWTSSNPWDRAAEAASATVCVAHIASAPLAPPPG
jgi:hypothetical protein